MKKVLFITGASGFIGTHLLRQLNLEEYNHVFCLCRTESAVLEELSKHNNFTFIKAGIFDSHLYREYLSLADIVVHLAALTGKAKPEEYFNINSKGTRVLLEQCNNLKITKFLFISSIAVKFQDIKDYCYAQSKFEAEEIVRKSGFQHTILRPTIVIGENSPILGNLLKLSKAPFVPIFGDGSTKIEPIHVDDLVAFILQIINNNRFENETIDVAGPEQTTIEGFIKLIHRLSYNKNPRVIHLPIRPITTLLHFLEKYFLSLLPFTAGQLASFTNDGIADKNPLVDSPASKMKPVNEMLELALSPVKETNRPINDLHQECILFTERLINCSPDSYIQEKYLEGHKVTKLADSADIFDTVLIKVANSSSFFTRLADIYTRVFCREAVLRKKFVFLLAILECYAPTYCQIDSVSERSKPFLYMRVGQKTIVFLMTLILSIIIFSPIHAICSLQVRLLKTID